MSLSVYVTELLKTNDCVIIPDLGGFIANYVSSVSNTLGDQFYPPTKEIVFNGKLKKNDGLLVNYICEQEGVGYLEARKIVSEFVSECQFKLENGERVEFEQLGALLFDQNEHLSFEASQKGNVRMDAFGLESFHFPQLVNKYGHTPKPIFRDKEPEHQAHRKPIVKYALLVLPILAAMYLIPKLIQHEPAVMEPTSNTASLSIADSPVSIHPDASSTSLSLQAEPKSDLPVTDKEVKEAVQFSEPMTVIEKKQEGAKIVSSEIPQPEKTIAQTIVNEPNANGKFHVVGGCFTVRENADKLAQQLIQKGYPAEVANLGKRFFRVSVQSFKTRKEAEEAMIKLFEAEPDADYWLMADKR